MNTKDVEVKNNLSITIVRKFYLSKNGTEPKPGRQEIVLRLLEGATLKESIV